VLKVNQYNSADIWSAGCVLSYVFTGKHPFDESANANLLLRILNIQMGRALVNLPEPANDLVLSMLHKEPECRPTSSECLQHPFFYDNDATCFFLQNVIELRSKQDEPYTDKPTLSDLLDQEPKLVFDISTGWKSKVMESLITVMEQKKRISYDAFSVNSLLNFALDVIMMYEEIPTDTQSKMKGPYDYLFNSFPALIVHSYNRLQVKRKLIKQKLIKCQNSMDDFEKLLVRADIH